MSARPAVLRWVGFLRLLHGQPAPRRLHRLDEARERARAAAQEALLSQQLRADARPRS